MIKRIVKLTFQTQQIEHFKSLFDESKDKIASFPGCQHVELLQNLDDPRIFFTLSHWTDEQALENYRKSQFFKETWAQTKVLFDGKPDAWSTVMINKAT